MNYRDFGRTGEKVSEIGFGAWALGGGWGKQDDADSVAALHTALDLGCTFIDTAQGYGNGRSERVIGRVLRERRGTPVFVATKTPPPEGPWPPSPYCRADERYPEAYLRANVEDRLRNLGVERLDLLQLHTWTRAWNADPTPLLVLRRLRDEGKIRFIGISTPEQDQDSVNDLMRRGLLDAVQVIYNIFQQEPAAELLPLARECGVGVIVRVVFDEGSLTGKFTAEHRFAADDFRSRYFEGDRLARTVARVARLQADIEREGTAAGRPLAETALRFALSHPAVSTVIPGIRNPEQARKNLGVSGLPPLGGPLLEVLRSHYWRRGIWYSGKT